MFALDGYWNNFYKKHDRKNDEVTLEHRVDRLEFEYIHSLKKKFVTTTWGKGIF